MRGFTTVRDMGGPAFGLKRAIDEGIVAGPRIYPSGAMITQTFGHGDFRQLSEIPRAAGAPLSHAEQMGGSAIADGVDEVLRRVREQLMLGAIQIKLTAGGGVASPHSPIDVSAFTEEELHAAVMAAESWGTCCCVRLHTARNPGGDCCRRQSHRAWPSDGRDDRQADGRQGHLVKHPAIPQRRGRQSPSRPGCSDEGNSGVRRDRPGIRVGKKVPAQDRLRHGYPIRSKACRSKACRPAGRATRQAGSLVHAGRPSKWRPWKTEYC
jgi:Amidohydrolase family